MDWLAAILEISGAWMVGNRNRWGFVVLMAGCAMWAATGVISGLLGLTFLAFVFFGVNIRNFWKWGE